MIREGATVAYVGHPTARMAVGDEGVVLADAGGASHVRWRTGGATGQITLVAHHDLVEGASLSHTALADPWALEAVDLTAEARVAYDQGGLDALVAALDDHGHLATLAATAENVVGHLLATVATDPSVADVVAALDPEEGEQVARRIAATLVGEVVAGWEDDE